MRSTDELVNYLNSYFCPQLWLPVGNLLGNNAVSEADTGIRSLPAWLHALADRLVDKSIDFDQPPGITKIDDATISIQIPASGAHHIHAEIMTPKDIPNADLGVEIAIQLTVSAAVPNPNLNLSVDFSWISDFTAFLFFGPAGVINKHLLESGIDFLIHRQVSPLIDRHLSGLRSYRFITQPDLRWMNPAAPPINGLFDPAFCGSKDPAARGYIDILLVADGYTQATINDFLTFTDQVRRYFAALASVQAEVPYRQFRTCIRIWSMPLVADNPDNVSERAVVPVIAYLGTPEKNFSDRKTTLNLANLARLAEIGLTARTLMGMDPIIVLAARISATDRAAAGVADDDTLVDNAQGPYIPLVTENVGGLSVDPTAQLVHELAHTQLGRYLADEYTGNNTGTYLGLEPKPRNVAVAYAMGKWAPWPQLANRREGAYAHERGIFRFQQFCRMRESNAGEVCPVCRAELAAGLLSQGHLQVGSNGVPGMIDILVEYTYPWSETSLLHAIGGSTLHLGVFAASTRSSWPTHVRLAIKGSSVPEAWQITWNVLGEIGMGTFAIFAGTDVDLELYSGHSVEITIRHDLGATGIFEPGAPAPQTSLRLVFDQPRLLNAPSLSPPGDLTQSVPVGATLVPVIDQSGGISLPHPVVVSAHLGAALEFDSLEASVDFRLMGPNQFTLRSPVSLSGKSGRSRSWSLPNLSPGPFVWAARTSWDEDAVTGSWFEAPRSKAGDCFEIGPLVFDKQPRPPADPFALSLLERATVPALPVGLGASSWHPNDRPISFHYEFRLIDEPWAGANVQTSLLHRDPANLDSVAIASRVSFNLSPKPGSNMDMYKWRVQAVDDLNRASKWVIGRPFNIYLPDERPVEVWRVIEILKSLDPRTLDPKGPPTFPRLFVKWGSSAEEQDKDVALLRDFAAKFPFRPAVRIPDKA